MTKAELLAIIADAPDDAVIYIDTGNGILHSHIDLSYEKEDGGTIVLGWIEAEDVDEEIE